MTLKHFKGVIVVCLLSLLLLITIPVSTNLYNQTQGIVVTDNSSNDLAEAKKSSIEELIVAYPEADIVGIVKIDGTNINEPVVQGSDNEYYLKHNILKKYDKKGTTFMDYRITVESKKVLIYSHNSSTLDVPFKELENYYDEEYLLEHPIIEIETMDGTKEYEIFSITIETSDWSYMKIDFSSKSEWYNHLTKLKDKSLYDTGIEVAEDDDVLILQTCSHHKDYKNFTNKYLLVMARRI